MSTAPLLAFKAGRSFRREGTNFIDANPTKGAISLYYEDGLLHFKWQNRETGVVEDDLILFAQDASFTKVSQSPNGRTYLLKFLSSNGKHFFWFQDASSARDEEFANNVNALLEDPERQLSWNTPSTSTSVPQASSSSQQSSSQQRAPSNLPLSSEQLAELRQLVTSMASEPAPVRPTVSLRDVLNAETLRPLFANHPELVPALFPHLPPDLPVPPSTEVLEQIITSPQFRAAVSNFDQALHTGLLGGLVRGLGLPEEAGTGVEPFLRAIQEQARQQDESGPSHQDQMDTD
ncbi:adhesion regulating molecule [Pyrrhoderma noxium]|uniref:Adhesion regulating molecule n=1 Tax=Pyrrhoderma noxium TaxID=2282107 RepID=A0A286UBH9_9AGAM|nr:adhesion regulating molecule [Pyrrhoderma noxium]